MLNGAGAVHTRTIRAASFANRSRVLEVEGRKYVGGVVAAVGFEGICSLWRDLGTVDEEGMLEWHCVVQVREL